MKVALYLRVSTADQTTLNQELELNQFCKMQGFEVFKIYKDEGISGSKTTRPALDLMLQDMRKGCFESVVVWKFDRLGRSAQHLLQVLEEMKNKKVRLIATAQNIDTSNSMGKFFFTILSAIGELEREMIRDRINLGLKRAKIQGKKLGRPTGSKDKKKRKKGGYYLRYQKTK